MDMGLVNAASNANPQQVGGTAALSVLRKAMDVQQQTALSLLQALPETPRYNNPSGVGANVDVKV
jgi:hypothetical protein